MSKVRDISNLSNVIRTDASGNVSFVSGSTTLATINTSGQLSGSSPVLSSSYALNADLLDGLDSTQFTLTSSFAAQTASFTAFTSSINSFSASILSYTASQNITNGTFTTTSSFNAQTASFTAFTASVNSFTASQLVLNGTYATTGSNTFAGIQTINSNLVVTGSITAQTLVVQTITSSVDFVTGSTRFGSILANTHVFTGSVLVSGNVGFGTGSASYNLEVSSGSSSPTELAIVNTNAAGAARLSLRNTERDFILTSNTADDLLSFAYGGSNRLQFNTTNQWFNSGNVGVGTTAPSMELDVSGSGLGGGIRSMGASGASGGKGVEIGYELGDFGTVLAYDRTGGVFKQLRINDLVHVGTGSTGNVGIGYTEPTVKLQVSGTIAAGSSTTGWGRFSYDATTNQVRIQASKDGTDSVSLSFYTQASGGGFAERMAISGSNVGIGTSNPSFILDVNDTNASGARGLRISTSSTAAGPGLFLYINSGIQTNWLVGNSYEIGNALEFRSSNAVGGNPGAAGTTRMLITSGGNIGIGMTSPDGRLTVTSATAGPYGTGTPDIAVGGNIGGSTTALQIYRTAATGGSIGIDSFRAGTSGAPLLLNAANGGRVGIGVTNPDAGLQIAQPAQDDQLTLGSAANNRDHAAFIYSGANKAEFLRYQSGVRLIFGSSANISNIDVLPGGTNGVRLSAGNTSWSAYTSDERKKKNFETVPGLEALLQINPVKYHFKTQDDSETKKLGFIAQNIQPLIPEMVHPNGEKAEDGSDILTIIPDYILPVLTKAIQELKAENDTLKEILQRNNIQ